MNNWSSLRGHDRKTPFAHLLNHARKLVASFVSSPSRGGQFGGLAITLPAGYRGSSPPARHSSGGGRPLAIFVAIISVPTVPPRSHNSRTGHTTTPPSCSRSAGNMPPCNTRCLTTQCTLNACTPGATERRASRYRPIRRAIKASCRVRRRMMGVPKQFRADGDPLLLARTDPSGGSLS